MHSSPETVLGEEHARDLLESVEYNLQETKRQLGIMLPRVGLHLPRVLEHSGDLGNYKEKEEGQ